MSAKVLNDSVRIGDVYVAIFDGDGSVQRGMRPAVVFQNNKGNAHSPNVVVFPMTSRVKKMWQPTHVFIPAGDSGLDRDSMVLCENPVCIPKTSLYKFITSLPRKTIKDIVEANVLASGGISFLQKEDLMRLYDKAAELNAVI